MTYHNSYIALADVFEDFDRDGLKMSWVYSFIGGILAELNITLYAKPQKIFEKLNLFNFKNELKNETEDTIAYPVGLLGSALMSQGVEDASKICKFLRGELEDYQNSDLFNLVYDFKELTADAGARYVVPIDTLSLIPSSDWKSGNIALELNGYSADIFSKANLLNRLHKSTILCVELENFEIDNAKLSLLLTSVRERHDKAIGKELSGDKKGRVGAPPKPWWEDFWIEVCGGLLDESLVPKSQKELREKLEVVAMDMGVKHGFSAMQEPTSKLWRRIEPEIRRIYGIKDYEN